MGILNQPLRRQVVGVAVVMLLPLAAGTLWSANRTRLERQSEVRDEALSVATMAVAYLDEYLKGLDGLASGLTRHPGIIALEPAEANRLFAAILHEQPVLTNVLLLSRDGEIRGSGVNGPPARSTRPWVADVIRSGRPVVSEFGIGRATGKPFVAMAYPVRGADSAIVGVLALTIDLQQLQTVFNEIPLPPGSVVSVIDREHRVLARTIAPAEYVGTTADIGWSDLPRSEMRAGIDGVERFYGDAPVGRAPWLLSVGIPRTVVAGRLAPLWRRNLLIALTSIVGALLISIALATLTARQLSALQQGVQRIAGGDLSPPVKSQMPNRELAELQDAFITMAANLRATHSALDRQVEQERRMNEMLQSLQRQVVRQERLAAVGLLVSGVAHELNNPLQAILGTAELLERHADLGPAALEEITFVKTQSGRAREIIRNLSRFSSQQSGPPSLISLPDVIKEVVQLRRTDLDAAGMLLEVRIESTRPVYANFTELEQVTLNFVINAQQALESVDRPGRILVRLFDLGKKVRLEVSDNGPGVDAADEAKLFQPFFTTKPVGKGTGLGLSVSYGIIESYGGTIGHRPNQWGGATFFFELPGVDITRDSPDDGPAVLQRPV